MWSPTAQIPRQAVSGAHCKLWIRNSRTATPSPVPTTLGAGFDQIVVGWRAMNDPGVPGIKFFSPLDRGGSKWRENRISADRVAVEDIKAADLDGDGKVDVVAAARQTKNLVIFFNDR